MDKRILYLSYDGLTDPLGQSQILPYIEGLSAEGYRFIIFSFEKKERFGALKEVIENRCLKKKIEWRPMVYHKWPPVLSTIYDLQSLYRSIIREIALGTINLIHSRSYLTALVALRIKKYYSIPFIFDMRGFWADERVDGKIWDLKNPVYKLIYTYFKRKERVFLEESAAVISLTHSGKNEIVRWFDEESFFGGNPDFYNHDRALAIERKTIVIPCAADLTHFNPELVSLNKIKWLCAVHGIDPTLEYLGYVGSLGTWYMADEMLLLYSKLLKSRPHQRFLILSHDEPQSLYERGEQLRIPQSHIIHIRASRKEVPVFMSLMAASVFFILPAYSKKASSPTKQGELMAMGVPVICNSGVGDVDQIVRDSKSGWVVHSPNETTYSEVVHGWSKIISLDKNVIREGAQKFYSLNQTISSYTAVYKQILFEES